MIESFIEGRVRLRSVALSDAKFSERIREELLKINGVRQAEVNPRTGGLLLEYDKASLPLSLLKRAAPLFAEIDALERLPVDERLESLEKLLRDVKGILSAQMTFKH
ncbi:MAG: heavy-metal-associated domain-containing protein [Synergistaceae bacterium]|jgi:hypothetical protein|nr:heavy-metal-associated domain-containing protein [Synergistaceae bacterium]